MVLLREREREIYLSGMRLSLHLSVCAHLSRSVPVCSSPLSVLYSGSQCNSLPPCLSDYMPVKFSVNSLYQILNFF